MMTDDYPGITRLAMATIPTGPGALAVAESMLSLMKAGGMSDQAAGYACDLLNLYVQAQALETALYLERAGTPRRTMYEFFDGVRDRFAHCPRALSRLIAALGPDHRRRRRRALRRSGSTCCINGLLATPFEGRLSAILPGLGARCKLVADPAARARAPPAARSPGFASRQRSSERQPQPMHSVSPA